MMRKPTILRKALATGLVLATGSFSTLLSTSAMAQAPLKLKAAGELAIVGNVLLNGTPAISGATIFTESKVKTADGAGAMISLGQGGRIDLGPNSEMVVRFTGSNIGGNLLAGNASVSAPAGVAVSVATAEATAVSEGKASSALTVDVSCGNTRLAATRNEAKLIAGPKVEVVQPGQEASAGTQNPVAPKCARLAAVKAAKLSPAALAALILAGIGAAVVGIIAGTSDTPASGVVVSGFRPR